MDRIFTATIYPYGSSAARNSSWGSILLPAAVFEGCTISCRRAARTCQPTTCTLDSGPRGREGGSCRREQSLFLVWAVNLLNTATIHRGLISESAIHLFVFHCICALYCMFVNLSMSHKHGGRWRWLSYHSFLGSCVGFLFILSPHLDLTLTQGAQPINIFSENELTNSKEWEPLLYTKGNTRSQCKLRQSGAPPLWIILKNLDHSNQRKFVQNLKLGLWEN